MNPLTERWKLEECHEVGIFNGSYMITRPDEQWPDDPDERKVVCRLPTGCGQFSEQLPYAKLLANAPELARIAKLGYDKAVMAQACYCNALRRLQELGENVDQELRDADDRYSQASNSYLDVCRLLEVPAFATYNED